MAADEFQARRARLVVLFAAHKLDALAVTFGANLRYLTGFTGSNGLLLALRGGDAIFFTDPRYKIQAAQEVSCPVQVSLGYILPQLVAAAKRAGVRRLGFDPAQMTCAQHESLKSDLPLGVSLAPVSGWIEQQRAVKSEPEIALIRRSVETNSAAFEQAVSLVRAGMRESDLAAELEYRMRRKGAEKPAFETIVAAGERSALPHAQPTRARMKPGDLVVVDMGAMQDGYASDMTRMLHLGRPSGKVKRLYSAVLKAQLAALDAVRPGVSAQHVDSAARRVLKAEKLDKTFVHSTGHGLGLEIHEPPRLGKKEKTRLQAGMTITIEPGVYLEGFGGIRIEDTVVVTPAGCEVLTPTSKELRTI
jgi:Xaa-Pro aminopeptidase